MIHYMLLIWCFISAVYSIPIFPEQINYPEFFAMPVPGYFMSQPVAPQIMVRNDDVHIQEDNAEYQGQKAKDPRLSVGEFIMGISWLPIEINVPDTIGWIGNGFQSLLSGIANRIPFLNRPQAVPQNRIFFKNPSQIEQFADDFNLKNNLNRFDYVSRPISDFGPNVEDIVPTYNLESMNNGNPFLPFMQPFHNNYVRRQFLVPVQLFRIPVYSYNGFKTNDKDNDGSNK